jgi:hypothetical protein
MHAALMHLFVDVTSCKVFSSLCVLVWQISEAILYGKDRNEDNEVAAFVESASEYLIIMLIFCGNGICNL